MTVFLTACCRLLLMGAALAHAPAMAQATQAEPETGPDTPAVVIADLPDPSASARELFARSRDAIVQVRVLLASANEQATLGSGFVVKDNGSEGALVVTNFHVIANLAMDPEKYRIELRGTNQRLESATLAAVDVIHDLAVLRTQPRSGTAPAPWQVLAINTTALPQGTPVFALGNPLELGFLISEGLYNGSVEHRLYEQMLFSGSLNAGMSGGPAINQATEVVGINVATRRDGEQLSFLVPARYAKALLAKASEGPHPTNWHAEIGQQLLAHQAHIFGKFQSGEGAPTVAGMATQQLAGRTVPTLDGSLTRCWARGRNGQKLRYRSDSLDCRLSEEVFAGSGVYAGALYIQHRLDQKDELALPQFVNLASHFRAQGGNEGDRNRAKGLCHDDYVSGAAQVYRVAVCVSAYRKFEGLFDYNLTATQVDSTQQRLRSSLSISGMSFDNAQALSRQFLERLP